MGKTKKKTLRPKVIIDDTLVDEYIKVKKEESELKVAIESVKERVLNSIPEGHDADFGGGSIHWIEPDDQYYVPAANIPKLIAFFEKVRGMGITVKEKDILNKKNTNPHFRFPDIRVVKDK